MVHRDTTKRPKTKAKTILRLPDLEQSKTAVLHSLGAASSQESYRHAMDEFIGWYCSEPRLSFNRTVVLRYRFFLEQKNLAASTINVRLAAVRRLAYEAANTGLLSPELAAGIRRVKGAKRLGVRIGNWLTAEQSKTLLRPHERPQVEGAHPTQQIVRIRLSPPLCRIQPRALQPRAMRLVSAPFETRLLAWHRAPFESQNLVPAIKWLTRPWSRDKPARMSIRCL
jgi:hypothetical protein